MQRCSTYNYNHVNFAKISIKFAHPGSRIICEKKKEQEQKQKQNKNKQTKTGASHCKHIQIAVVKNKCMPAKSTAQYNN